MSVKHELWQQSLVSRIAQLKPGTTRIAYVAVKSDTGTFRYRAFNPVDAIQNSDIGLSASFFFLSDLDRYQDLSDFADILVLVRVPYDDRVDRLIRSFTRLGKRVFFDVDDLIVDPKLDSLVAANLGYELQGESLYWWSAFIANWQKTLSMCDEIITTTPPLAHAIRDLSSKPVHIVPNTFNRFQLDASPQSVKKPGRSKGLHLGYFSGSHSHEHDFDVVRPALVKYMTDFPASRLTIAGHLDIGDKLSAVGDRVTMLPFMDFRDLQKAMGAVDLNLVPLQRSPFTDAKSELKYFEAAIAGTLTLASNNPVFSSVIRDGVNGFVAAPQEWETKLRIITELKADKRRSIADAARTHSLKTYSPDALSTHLTSIFGA